MKRLRLWWVVALVLGIGASVSAQDARSLFLNGQAAYQQGNYEAAVEAWRQAYELDPRPGLLYNLAQAYGRLGRTEEEQTALQRFVEEADEPNDPQVQNARARLAAIAARLRRTAITVSGVPEGAEVLIDDVAQSSASGFAEPIPVQPGPHRIVVRKEGYEDFTASVVVRGGDALLVPVQLRERQGATVIVQGDGGMRGAQIAGAVMLPIGGVALLAGGVLGLVALKKADGAIAGSADASSAHGLAVGADVALPLGAALSVTGLILLVVGGGDGDEAPPVQATPVAGAGFGGLVVQGRF